MKFCPLVLKILDRNEILAQIKGHDSGTNVKKMMCDNPKLDLVNMNAYIKFGENISVSSQNMSGNEIIGGTKGHINSGTDVWKMGCNNPKLDLVIINAYIKFGENKSSSSQDIEQKRNFGVNKGP